MPIFKVGMNVWSKVAIPYPEMRGQRELTIVAVCSFAYTSG